MSSNLDLTGKGSLAEQQAEAMASEAQVGRPTRVASGTASPPMALEEEAPGVLASGTGVFAAVDALLPGYAAGGASVLADDDDFLDEDGAETLANDESDGDDDAPVALVLDGEVPSTSKKIRRRQRRSRPRSKTIALKRLTREELRVGALMFPPVEEPRPVMRAQCQAEEGPCPWVSCKHHLYLDINPETGSIKLNFPDLEPWDLKETCALNVAERGGITLEEVGEIMNLTRERIRQVEVRGLLKLKNGSPSPDELGAWLLNPPPPSPDEEQS